MIREEGRVVASTGSGLRTSVMARSYPLAYPLVADEPEKVGGTDSGPTPYDYLLVALGSCTGMTLRMYADRKGWPLEAVTVRLNHRRIHARDCLDCETEDGRIDRIEREIELDGPLDEPQRRHLLEIAERCPVHRTLTSEVKIDTRLLEIGGRAFAPSRRRKEVRT
jgi:uncharacterized OsmC-like protein